MSEIICSDCNEEMKELGENSIDSIVTDPPYGLAFMGKSWDDFEPEEYQKFSNKWGEEAIRALKPGGYLLAFSGTRTYHRMVVGLEDAGFEIKDQIDYLYGSGFPKSHDISKAIDKHFGKEDEREEWEEGRNGGPRNKGESVYKYGFEAESGKRTVSKPATPEASEWNGWGTALKPSHEPIVLAQKPREGTYAENVLEYGIGGLNIDGCRIGVSENDWKGKGGGGVHDRWEGEEPDNEVYGDNWKRSKPNQNKGRWPPNAILDPSAARLLDSQSGVLKSGETKSNQKHKGSSIFGNVKYRGDFPKSEGGASRFFYCSKAHKRERNAGLEDLEEKTSDIQARHRSRRMEDTERIDGKEPAKAKNDIATLKPINLMRYLVRLVTPPSGTVLDPFAGSGTTGCACEIEGFDYILIEKRERFADVIAPKRIEYWSKEKNWSELKDHEELEDPVKRKTANLEAFM